MTRQHMTVCDLDIARFNIATRNMSLEESSGFLQGFYERIGEVLLAHNGRLIKYLGDGALLAFSEGHEEVALRAVWTLGQAYREYADALGTEARASSLGAGIATGEVIAGQMGHPQMPAQEVLGKPVTVAAALARCGGIVIDGPTQEAVRGRVTLQPVSEGAEVRGYRVLGFA